MFKSLWLIAKGIFITAMIIIATLIGGFIIYASGIILSVVLAGLVVYFLVHGYLAYKSSQ
jgi:hypothetical protein